MNLCACQRTYVCMTHGLERERETQKEKRLDGRRSYELWHTDYTQIKIKNKAQGQAICTDDIRVWFHSPMNYNIVWFLHTVKGFPLCYSSLEGCSLVDMCEYRPWKGSSCCEGYCALQSLHMFFTTDKIWPTSGPDWYRVRQTYSMHTSKLHL